MRASHARDWGSNPHSSILVIGPGSESEFQPVMFFFCECNKESNFAIFAILEKGIITKIKREDMKYLLFIVLLVSVIITAGCTNYIPKQSFSPATTEAEFGSAYSDSEQEVIVYSAQKNETFTSLFYNVSSTKEAASGNTFVIIDARIKNIGADKITVFPHDFQSG